MAKALVNNLAAPWNPSKYSDQYRDNLMRIIQGKIKGKEVVLAPGAKPRSAEVVDLMERLRRSLAQTAGGRGRRAASPSKPVNRTTGQRGARSSKQRPKKQSPHAA
jgi:DNA end-binding protein Ku